MEFDSSRGPFVRTSGRLFEELRISTNTDHVASNALADISTGENNFLLPNSRTTVWSQRGFGNAIGSGPGSRVDASLDIARPDSLGARASSSPMMWLLEPEVSISISPNFRREVFGNEISNGFLRN